MKSIEDRISRAAAAIDEALEAGRSGVTLQPAAEISPEAVSWLWPAWLARGKVHILAGPPGVGKSTLAFTFAAAISSGGELPDGTVPTPSHVAIWTGEDGVADTVVPRLLANGADLSRILIVRGRAGAPFDPATDMPMLEAAIRERGVALSLLILDPIVSAVATDSHKNTEVRRALQPIADLAAALNVAVLGISHFTKGTRGMDPVERVTGSIAFGAVARLVMAAAKSTDDGGDGCRLLVRAKSNLGEDSGGFRYDIEQVDLEGRPLIQASRVVWKGPIAGSARDALAEAETYSDPDERTKVDDAADWLTDTLPPTGMSYRELVKHAKAQEISPRTLQRARQRVGVEVERRGFGQGSWWMPPVPSVPDAARTENAGTNGSRGANGAATGFGNGQRSVAPNGASIAGVGTAGANGHDFEMETFD